MERSSADEATLQSLIPSRHVWILPLREANFLGFGLSSSSSSDENETLNIGFSARLGISLGVISLMVLLIVVTYFWECKRGFFRHHPPAASAAGNNNDGGGGMSMEELEGVMVVDGGGDFQKIQFSQAKVQKGSDVVGTCCSICLVDYKEDDWLLQLPHCGHMFHVDCVRVWLCLHGTCPVCRTSLPPRHRATTTTSTTAN